ncbi:TPA: hypothetical protein ACOEA5_000884 [Enterobacter kobei]
MSNIDKQALREEVQEWKEIYCEPADAENLKFFLGVEALLDELEAKDKRLNEILTPNMLLPVIDEMDADNLLHVIKTASENYSLLYAKWVAAEKRIAEQVEIIANQEKWTNDVEATMIAATDRAEAAEKRIAELEAREVRLPELCVGVVQGGHAVMVPYAAGHWFNKTAILEMPADAGINIAAAGKGE